MPSSPKSTLLIAAGVCLLLCPVLFPVAAWIAVKNVPREYTSEATIEIKMDHFGLTPFPPDIGRYVDGQLPVIRSTAVLYPVIDQLGLAEKWSLVGGSYDKHNQAYKKLLVMTRGVRQIGDSSVVKVSVSDSDPQQAAAIANAMVESYQKRRMHDQVTMIEQDEFELNEEIEKQRKSVQKASDECEEIRNTARVSDPKPEGDGIPPDAVPEYKEAKKKYIDARQLLAAAEVRLSTVKSELSTNPPPSPVTVIHAAVPSTTPSNPNLILIMAAAACLGFVCAIPGATQLSKGLELKRLEIASAGGKL